MKEALRAIAYSDSQHRHVWDLLWCPDGVVKP